MAKKKLSLASKIKTNSQESSSGADYGYLRLPEGIKMFKVEPGGRISGDILPYEVSSEYHPDASARVPIEKGDLWYKRPFWIHRNVGGDHDTLICPKSIGQPCPICKYRSERMKAGAEKGETDQMRTSSRNLYVWVPIDDDNHERKPHIWDISAWCFQNMLKEEIEDSEENAQFANLEDGWTLKIRFSAESMPATQEGQKATSFAKVSRIDFVKRDSQYDESILAKVPKLDEVLIVMPYKKIEAMFFELDQSAAGSDDAVRDDVPDTPTEEKTEPEEKEKPTPPARKAKTVKPPEPAEEPKEEKKAVPAEDNPCPYGYVFGDDFEKYSECETECDMWDACLEKNEQ